MKRSIPFSRQRQPGCRPPAARKNRKRRKRWAGRGWGGREWLGFGGAAASRRVVRPPLPLAGDWHCWCWSRSETETNEGREGGRGSGGGPDQCRVRDHWTWQQLLVKGGTTSRPSWILRPSQVCGCGFLDGTLELSERKLNKKSWRPTLMMLVSSLVKLRYFDTLVFFYISTHVYFLNFIRGAMKLKSS